MSSSIIVILTFSFLYLSLGESVSTPSKVFSKNERALALAHKGCELKSVSSMVETKDKKARTVVLREPSSKAGGVAGVIMPKSVKTPMGVVDTMSLNFQTDNNYLLDLATKFTFIFYIKEDVSGFDSHQGGFVVRIWYFINIWFSYMDVVFDI